MNRNIERVIIIISLALVSIYLISATGIIPLPIAIARTALFLLGPFAIIGITSLASSYTPHEDYKLIQHFGHIFIVIAFGLFTTMLVVQQAGFSFYESNKEFITNAKEVFRLVNSVQLGIDISFDIFYCLGILFFSFSFLKLKGLGLLVGIIGVTTSIGLLSLNMITFPIPPAESGLIDLGPFSIIGWGLGAIYIESIHNKPHKAIFENARGDQCGAVNGR